MSAINCTFCGAVIDGGPGGWYALETLLEGCEVSPTSFHEAMCVADHQAGEACAYESHSGRNEAPR